MKIGNLDGPPVHTLEQFHQAAQKNLQELIFLEPYPDAPMIDHEFESPTFKRIIEQCTKEYLNKYGISK